MITSANSANVEIIECDFSIVDGYSIDSHVHDSFTFDSKGNLKLTKPTFKGPGIVNAGYGSIAIASHADTESEKEQIVFEEVTIKDFSATKNYRTFWMDVASKIAEKIYLIDDTSGIVQLNIAK